MQTTELALIERLGDFWYFKIPEEWPLGQQIHIFGMAVETDDDEQEDVRLIFTIGKVDIFLKGERRIICEALHQVFNVITEPVTVTVPERDSCFYLDTCCREPKWTVQWMPAFDVYTEMSWIVSMIRVHRSNMFLCFDIQRHIILLKFLCDEPIDLEKIHFSDTNSHEINVHFDVLTSNMLLFRRENFEDHSFHIWYQPTDPSTFFGFTATSVGKSSVCV